MPSSTKHAEDDDEEQEELEKDNGSTKHSAYFQGRLPLDINEILAWIFSSKRRRRGQVTGGREGPPIAQI